MKKTIFFSSGIQAGAGCRTLVMALVGTSSYKDYDFNIDKIDAIASLPNEDRPDIIADLSIRTERNTKSLYRFIIDNHPPFIVSTLPIYHCLIKNGKVEPNELLESITLQLESGVRMLTIHPTATFEIIEKSKLRKTPVTSRGGSIVIADLISRGKPENVYLRIIDDIIAVAKKYKAVISLGATFRSANIFDSWDIAQQMEIDKQEEIANYITAMGVDVIVEGPGHAPPVKLREIGKRYRQLGFPIMPLGPIPTDTAIGQDHISSAIGAALLGMEGSVDIIAAVTREEHTGGIPTIESTIEAIRAAKVTAHIIDLSKTQDYSQDLVVANHRATHHTCVASKNTEGCARCLDLCPLIGPT